MEPGSLIRVLLSFAAVVALMFIVLMVGILAWLMIGRALLPVSSITPTPSTLQSATALVCSMSCFCVGRYSLNSLSGLPVSADRALAAHLSKSVPL